MPSITNRMLTRIQALIAQVGQSASILVEPMVDDPADGRSAQVGETVTHQVTVSPPTPYKQPWGETSLIKEPRFTCYLAGKDLTFVPKAGDKLVAALGTYVIVDVVSFTRQTSVIAYELTVVQ